jgi:hypothetical protein
VKTALLCLFGIFLPALLEAQQQPRPKPRAAQDTMRAARPDVPNAPADAVQFFAADSALFLLGDSTRINLFGRAKLEHSSGTLNANQVQMNTGTNVMEAKGGSETDTLGRPLLKRETDEIRSTRILYNYKTGKGKFEEARVNVQQGVLQGEKVKRAEEHVIYVGEGLYSTCTLDHPHFFIRARKMKVVDEEEIFFTRARLYLLDIPYPLILPFGYVPAKWDKTRSGLLAPTFQNQGIATRGYGITNLGWFQYFNDYLTGTFAFGAFTSGTWNNDVSLQYRKTDRYSGTVQLGQSFERGFEPTDPDFVQSKRRNRNLLVQHAQTISPWSNISANINLRTSDYYSRNSTNLGELSEQSTNSTASWNYSDPAGRFSFNTSMQHNQNFLNNTVQLSGPNSTFSLRRISPFKRTESTSTNARFYESLTIGYTNSMQSNFNYVPLAADSATVDWVEALLYPSRYRLANNFSKNSSPRHINAGMVQRVSMDSKLLPGQYLQMNGNVSFTEYWYPETIEKTWNPATKKIETKAVGGFAAARDYQFGLSFNTTIYGISNRRLGRFDGFRHTVRPSLSFSYRPDFSNDRYGYYNSVQSDTTGLRFQKYSRFEGGTVGGPGMGTSKNLSLSVNNVFETRTVHRDTTGEQRKTVLRLIDDLSFRGSYDFSRDEFRLSDLSVSMVSSIFRSLRINANGNFNFYNTDSTGQTVNTFLWDTRRKPMRLTSFSIATSTSFAEGSLQPSPELPYHPREYDPFNQADFRDIDPWNQRRNMVRWDIPWSISVSASYRYNAQNPLQKNRSALIELSDIRFLLTPKWQVATGTGYDFISKKPTYSRFSINRNLHCWDLSMEWMPLGPQKYFIFRLNMNSSQFQNLFQKLPGLNRLNTSSGINSRY